MPAQPTVAAGSETIAVGTISVPNAESIVTASVLHVGQQIGNGSIVAQVAGRPVFAFAGSTPMYRSLGGGESGPDIAQLQQDLASIGYGITDSAASYGASTSAASPSSTSKTATRRRRRHSPGAATRLA